MDDRDNRESDSRILRIHSREELIQTAYLLDAIGLLHELRDVVQLGDRTHKSDAARLFDDLLLVIEYDPVFYHPASRGDATKTQKLLALREDILILRIRVDATQLDVDDPRYVEVCVPRNAPGAILKDVATALASHLPEPFATRLCTCGAHRRPLAEHVANELFQEINRSAKEHIEDVRRLFIEHDVERSMDASSFIGTPLKTIRDALEYLKSIGLTPQKIAARPDLLWKSVEKNLKPTFEYLKSIGMAPQKIATQPTLLQCSLEQNLKPTFEYLKSIGLTSQKIAMHPNLLLCSIEQNLKPTFEYLKSIGIAPQKIAMQPDLLYKSVEKNLKPTFEKLKSIGLTPQKIAAYPNLLVCSMEQNIKPTFEYLKSIGLTPQKIATHPDLLWKSVEQNLKPTFEYLKSIGLTSQKIAMHPNLLTCSVDKNLAPTAAWLLETFPAHDLNNDPIMLMCSLKRMQCAHEALGEKATWNSVKRMRVA